MKCFNILSIVLTYLEIGRRDVVYTHINNGIQTSKTFYVERIQLADSEFL